MMVPYSEPFTEHGIPDNIIWYTVVKQKNSTNDENKNGFKFSLAFVNEHC